MQIIIKNPLEQFEILDLFSITSSLLGSQFILTNIGLYILIVTFLSCFINIWIASENKKLLLHSHGTFIQESIYATVLGAVKNQIGSFNEKYLPIIFTLFIFILFNNLVGIIPYAFTPTSHLVLTLSLSIAVFIGVTIIGLKIHKFHFFSLFIPSGTPLILVPLLVIIESISYLARAISLGLRLGCNLIAGIVWPVNYYM